MEELKGLILCGGRGTRLRPFSFSRPKQLMPIANRPVISYAIQQLIQAGIREIGIVIPPSFQPLFEHTLGHGDDTHAITYIHQAEPKGLAHAVLCAKDFIGGDSFVTYLGDNYYAGHLSDLMEQFNQDRPDTILCVSQVPNPSQFGVVHLDGDKVTKLEEKPKNPTSSYVIVGIYLFSPIIFEAITQIPPSNRNEYEITDAIQWLIEQGRLVSVVKNSAWWKDTGNSKALLECNRNVLSNIRRDISHQATIQSCSLHGDIVVEATANIENCVIQGPVIIASGSKIRDSYIGPFSVIGSDVECNGSFIQGSIVLQGAKILNMSTLIHDSIIGANTVLEQRGDHFKRLQIFIGDHSDIIF